MPVALNKEWLALLGAEFSKPYMVQLKEFLRDEQARGQLMYPRNSEIFNALNLTSPDKVKVVILGQDPYHGPGQAHGLSFSVRRGTPVPPSLRNIYIELAADVKDFIIPDHGELTEWAKQGVLLLNATLTVAAGRAASHQKRGWETFSDSVIKAVNDNCNHAVFILWGRFAQQKEVLINKAKHCVIKSAHPSPLAAHNGFFGSRPFSKANIFLQQHGIQPVNWSAINS